MTSATTWKGCGRKAFAEKRKGKGNCNPTRTANA
jgi:hypothetical protein